MKWYLKVANRLLAKPYKSIFAYYIVLKELYLKAEFLQQESLLCSI